MLRLSWPVALAALVLASCEPAPTPLVSPPWEGEALGTVLIFIEDGASVSVVGGAPGSDELDFSYRANSEDARLTLTAVGYECDSLSALGATVVEGRLSVEHPLRRPEIVWRSEYDGSAQREWMRTDMVDAALSEKLELSFQPETICRQFDATELGPQIEPEHPGVVLGLDPHNVLVGSEGAGLELVREDGSAADFVVDGPAGETPPALAGALDEHGELWLYGSGGRLWHGPKLGGRFVAEPPNPDVVDCEPEDPTEPRIFNLTTGMVQGRPMVIASEDTGGLYAFDAVAKQWEVLADPEVGSDGFCPFARSKPLFTDEGQLVVFYRHRTRLRVFDGATVEDRNLPDFASAMAFVDGDLFVGTNGEELYRREDNGRWTRLAYRMESIGLVMAIAPLEGALLFGGDSGGRFSIFDLKSESMCETNAVEGIGGIEWLVPVSEGFIAVPWFDDEFSKNLLMLRPAEPDVCRPHLP